MSLIPYWLRHLRYVSHRDPIVRAFEEPFAVFSRDPFFRDPAKFLRQVSAPLDHTIEGFYSDSDVKVDGKKMEVSLDVHDFKPEQIRVRTIGNEVMVEGKETRGDGWTRSHFQWKFLLPEGFPPERVECHFDKGKLLLVAFRAEPLEERSVPIQEKEKTEKVEGGKST